MSLNVNSPPLARRVHPPINTKRRLSVSPRLQTSVPVTALTDHRPHPRVQIPVQSHGKRPDPVLRRPTARRDTVNDVAVQRSPDVAVQRSSMGRSKRRTVPHTESLPSHVPRRNSRVAGLNGCRGTTGPLSGLPKVACPHPARTRTKGFSPWHREHPTQARSSQ
jgi:hypothetical protein